MLVVCYFRAHTIVSPMSGNDREKEKHQKVKYLLVTMYVCIVSDQQY